MRTEDEQLNWLIKTYFSDPRKRQTLAAGEVLITAGEPNRRLYLVLSGCLAGYSQGEGEEIFKAEPGDFAGILSFFSGERIATTWVRAVCHSEVAYIDRDQQPVPPNDDLDAQFMPVVVRALVGRQQHIQELAEERAEVMGRLQDVEKLASLGQMAAGVAHELNNAISVLSHGTKHLAEEIPERLATLPELHRRFLRLGIEQGRRISSREVRARLPKFERGLGLSRPAARSLARTGIEPADLAHERGLQEQARDLERLWDVGATLHDMEVAASQSEHVVRSMRTLGQRSSDREDVDINDSIQSALALTRNKLKNARVELDLSPETPSLLASRGELTQIWVNLLQNAARAMEDVPERESVLYVRSRPVPDGARVEIADNGPGIPRELLPRIFQPNVTTRVKGLSFGLGLGLTIVQRLVNEYGGNVDVDTSAAGTTVTVTLSEGPES